VQIIVSALWFYMTENTTGSIGSKKLYEVVCGSNALRKLVSGNDVMNEECPTNNKNDGSRRLYAGRFSKPSGG